MKQWRLQTHDKSTIQSPRAHLLKRCHTWARINHHGETTTRYRTPCNTVCIFFSQPHVWFSHSCLGHMLGSAHRGRGRADVFPLCRHCRQTFLPSLCNKSSVISFPPTCRQFPVGQGSAALKDERGHLRRKECALYFRLRSMRLYCAWKTTPTK